MQTLKTFTLFAALTALLIIIGYFIGGTTGAVLFFAISLVMNFISYWFSDKIALSMVGAQPLSLASASQVYNDTQKIAQTMGIPVPKLYITSQAQPNAFATGRGPGKSAICFTQGILQLLTRDELRGVIAHEMAHIKNRDVLISTIAAVLAGTVSSIANIGFFLGSSRNDERPNPLVQLLLLITAPIAATLIQLAISRSREFAADEAGAAATKQPAVLAEALVKIHNVAEQIPMDVNQGLAALYFENPLHNSMSSLFSTHPPVQERVRNLLQMQSSAS